MTSEPTPLYGTSPGTSPPPAGATAGDATARAVSVPEAAAALGVSVNTIRRWIKAGELRAEQVERPQGVAWHVHLPRHVPAGTSHAPPDGTSQHVPPAPAAGTSHGTSLVPPAQQQAEALATYAAAILAPVLAELATARAQLVAQAEELGTLRERLAAAEAQSKASPEANESPGPPAEASPPWWARLVWWRRV